MKDHEVVPRPLLLNDLLRFDELDLDNVKVKFNRHNGSEDPLDIYKSDPELVNSQWFLWYEGLRYFSVGQIAICFLQMTSDTHLLTTVKQIDAVLAVDRGIGYDAHEVDRFQPYFGRVIVKYRKRARNQGLFFRGIKDNLEVLQVLPTAYDGDEFPGYDRVRLSHLQLKAIIDRNKRDWVAALEHQKAVYLLTDTSNGKLYVGSATAQDGMLLQRWRNYASTGHGGNRDLRLLGFDHISAYFQFSILENYNAKVDDRVVLAREAWWKRVLCSGSPHGYNGN